MPIYRKAKEIILNGDIGEIYEIKIEHGKANLMWTHPHSTDLINFYNPNSKVKFIQSSCEFDENDISANNIDSDPILNFAFIKYENDINGIISCSNGMNTIISGTKGKIEVLGDGSFLKLRTLSRSPLLLKAENILVERELSGTQNAFSDLVESIEKKSQLGISYDEIINCHKILFGIALSSIKNGLKINVSEIDKKLNVSGRIGNLYT